MVLVFVGNVWVDQGLQVYNQGFGYHIFFCAYIEIKRFFHVMKDWWQNIVICLCLLI
jgi:hypothetical protein